MSKAPRNKPLASSGGSTNPEAKHAPASSSDRAEGSPEEIQKTAGIEQDDLLSEPSAEAAPRNQPGDERVGGEDDITDSGFVAAAADLLQLNESQVELVADELSAPKLATLPQAEQAGALTLIGDLARFRELARDARGRLHEANEADRDIAGLVEEARRAAVEFDEVAKSGTREIREIQHRIDMAREKKADAERRRIDAEVRLERRTHVKNAITADLAAYGQGESDREERLKVLLGEKKKS